MAALTNPPQNIQTGKDGNFPKQDEQKPKSWFIGSVDQGTTSTRFLILDGLGKPVASHQIGFKQLYPHPG